MIVCVEDSDHVQPLDLDLPEVAEDYPVICEAMSVPDLSSIVRRCPAWSREPGVVA